MDRYDTVSFHQASHMISIDGIISIILVLQAWKFQYNTT